MIKDPNLQEPYKIFYLNTLPYRICTAYSFMKKVRVRPIDERFLFLLIE